MKLISRFILISLLVFITIAASAQSRQQQKTDSVFRLVAKYIKVKKADPIYELASPEFKQYIKLNDFRDYISNSFFLSGELRKDSLINFVNNVKASYMLQFDYNSLMLSISLDNNNKINYFKSDPYIILKSKIGRIPSSNLLTTLRDRKVDTAAQKYISKSNTVGLTIGILKNGVINTYAYGEKARGNNELPDNSTVFEIGSITKTFTATILAWYVTQGKASLNDPITKYLPDSVAANPQLKNITLVMLSNHSSGLAALPDNFTAHTAYNSLNPYKNYTRQLLFSYLKRCTLKSAPGEKYVYSNLAVGLLGNILEKIGGKPYAQLVKEIICNPLGMKSTGQFVPKASIKNIVPTYNEQGAETPAWEFDAMAAMGSVRSTIDDMMLYVKANMNNTAQGPLYKAIDLTHQITFNNDAKLGLGWHVIEIRGVEYYFHNGGTGGSSSFLAFNKERNIAVVILSNSVESTDTMGYELLTSLDH